MGLFSTKKKRRTKNKNQIEEIIHSEVKANPQKAWSISFENDVDEDENDWGLMGVKSIGPSHKHEVKTPLRHGNRFSDYYESDSPVQTQPSIENKEADSPSEVATPIAPKKSMVRGLRGRSVFSSKKKKKKIKMLSAKKSLKKNTKISFAKLKQQSLANVPKSNRFNKVLHEGYRKPDKQASTNGEPGIKDYVSSSDETETANNIKRVCSPIRGILKSSSYSSKESQLFTTPYLKGINNDVCFRNSPEKHKKDKFYDNIDHGGNKENRHINSPVYHEGPHEHFLPQYLPAYSHSPLKFSKRNLNQIQTPDGGICSKTNVSRVVSRTWSIFDGTMVVAIRKKMADCIAPPAQESPNCQPLNLNYRYRENNFENDQFIPTHRPNPFNHSANNSGSSDEYSGAPRKNMNRRPQLKRLNDSKYSDIIPTNDGRQQVRNREIIHNYHQSNHQSGQVLHGKHEYSNRNYIGQVKEVSPQSEISHLSVGSQVHNYNSGYNKDNSVYTETKNKKYLDINASYEQSFSNENDEYECNEPRSMEETEQFVGDMYYNSASIESEDHNESACTDDIMSNTRAKQSKLLNDGGTPSKIYHFNAPVSEISRSFVSNLSPGNLSESMGDLTVSTISDISQGIQSEPNSIFVTEDDNSVLRCRDQIFYDASGSVLNSKQSAFLKSIMLGNNACKYRNEYEDSQFEKLRHNDSIMESPQSLHEKSNDNLLQDCDSTGIIQNRSLDGSKLQIQTTRMDETQNSFKSIFLTPESKCGDTVNAINQSNFTRTRVCTISNSFDLDSNETVSTISYQH